MSDEDDLMASLSGFVGDMKTDEVVRDEEYLERLADYYEKVEFEKTIAHDKGKSHREERRKMSNSYEYDDKSPFPDDDYPSVFLNFNYIEKIPAVDLYNEFGYDVYHGLAMFDMFGNLSSYDLDKIRSRVQYFIKKHRLNGKQIDRDIFLSSKGKTIVIEGQTNSIPIIEEQKEQEKVIIAPIMEKQVGCGLTIGDFVRINYPMEDEKAYVTIGQKIGKDKNGEVIFTNNMVKLEEVGLWIDIKKDCYISTNTFYTTTRGNEFVRNIISLHLDIDYYNTKWSLNQVLEAIDRLVEQKQIFLPTVVISTGRGLQIRWNLEADRGVSDKSKKLHGHIERYLCEVFKEYGSDSIALSVSQLMRIPGTINTKNNQEASIIQYNEKAIYSMEDFKQFEGVGYKKSVKEYNKVAKEIEERKAKKELELIEGKKKEPKKKKSQKRVFATEEEEEEYYANLKTPQTLHEGRVSDIEKLVEMRNGDVKRKRSYILHIYHYFTLLTNGGDEKDALNKAIILNSKFYKSFTDAQVKSYVTSSKKAVADYHEKMEKKEYHHFTMKGGYSYKTETLIERLEITEEEQREMQVTIDFVEKRRRKTEREKQARRDENGLTKREREKQDTINLIQEWKAKGLSQSEVAKETGKSLRTVKNYWNEKAEYYPIPFQPKEEKSVKVIKVKDQVN